jgi:hypothetical protein
VTCQARPAGDSPLGWLPDQPAVTMTGRYEPVSCDSWQMSNFRPAPGISFPFFSSLARSNQNNDSNNSSNKILFQSFLKCQPFSITSPLPEVAQPQRPLAPSSLHRWMGERSLTSRRQGQYIPNRMEHPLSCCQRTLG